MTETEAIQLKNQLEIIEHKYLKQINKWTIVDHRPDKYEIDFVSVRGEIFVIFLDKQAVGGMSPSILEDTIMSELRKAILDTFVQ